MQQRSFLVWRLCAVIYCLLATVGTGHAAADYYLLLPGVAGESPVPKRSGWIEARGFGAVVDRESATTSASFPPIFVGKWVDKASPLLTRAISEGRIFKEATLETVDRITGEILYRVLLKDVIVTALTQDGLAGSATRAAESITLDYTSVEWTYTSGTAQTSTHFNKETSKGGTGPLPGASPTPPVDSDGDGMPDSYETANGLNVGANDAQGDLDGDGATNLSEYIAQTRANNATSVFRVRGISQADGSMLITWNSVAGKVYHVLGSTSPAGPFTLVKQNIVSAGDGETSTTVSASGAMLFFRVQTQ